MGSVAAARITRYDERCLSDMKLDELLLNELDDLATKERERHIGTCLRCHRRFQELAEDRAGFDIPLSPSVSQKSRSSRWLGVSASILVAASALFFLSRSDEPEIRRKGSLSLTLEVKQGARTFLATQKDPLSPGDVVQFIVPPQPGRHLAIFNIEASQKVTVFYPYGQDLTSPLGISRKGNYRVPGAIVLDESQGQETIFAMVCDDPIQLRLIENKIENLGLDKIAVPDSCDSATHRFTKGASR